jgi:hypothetical protein
LTHNLLLFWLLKIKSTLFLRVLKQRLLNRILKLLGSGGEMKKTSSRTH